MSLKSTEVPLSPETSPHYYMEWQDWLIMAVFGAIATILLFINLDDKYLWQDEAATAVLGERMIQYGKPLAYDGKNLISMDNFTEEDEQTISLRTGNKQTAIQYLIDRHDFKADTAWTGQPWGQFIIAGLSLSLFGHNTFAARAPFSAAAVFTIVLLYWFIRKQFQDRLMASVAVSLLLFNTYWIIHSRQCRYYALTCLMIVVIFMAYAYWQRGGRFGWIFFVIAAWCWFQVDFGSFWLVVGILLMLAALHAWPKWTKVAGVTLTLAITIAPWIWYYEISKRLKTTSATWSDKFSVNLFHMNQFMIPIVVLIAAGLLLIFLWRKVLPLHRQLLLACLLIFPGSLLWVTSVASWFNYRYIVLFTPLAALLMAWLFVGFSRWLVRAYKIKVLPAIPAFALCVSVVLCPLPSNLISWMIPVDGLALYPLGIFIRPELTVLQNELLEHHIDPNRAVIEFIRKKALPDDEILVNYEDIPFMFYTSNPIRGGIPCFRVEDRNTTPRFLVIRGNVPFLHWPVFIREADRYIWKEIPLTAPDITWGNNPDPVSVPDLSLLYDEQVIPNLILAENMGYASPNNRWSLSILLERYVGSIVPDYRKYSNIRKPLFN